MRLSRSKSQEKKPTFSRRRAAMPSIGLEDRRNAHVARVFFDACTRVSPNTGDILPQEVRADHVPLHAAPCP